MPEQVARYIAHVADKELIVPFDPNRTVAELTADIDRRCQRQIVASIIGRRVVSLHARMPSAAKLKGNHLLRDVLSEGDAVYVVLTHSTAAAARARAVAVAPDDAEPAHAAALPAPTRQAARPARPASASSARATPTSQRQAVDILFPVSSGALARPHSAGRRAAAGAWPSSADPASHSAVALSVTELVDAEERATQRGARRPSREAWVDRDFHHNAATPRDAAVGGGAGARTSTAALTLPTSNTPRLSSAGTPRDGRAPNDAAEVERQKRLEAEEEVLIARRKALHRFPSHSRAQSTVGRSQLPTTELAARARSLTRRERFLHRLLREANASATGAGTTPARHQPTVPEWKEKILDRAKVAALAPGRAAPQLYRSVPLPVPQAQQTRTQLQHDASRPLVRPASAGALRPASPNGSLAGGRPAPGASAEPSGPALRASVSMSKLISRQVGKRSFSASSAKYLERAVHELEAAIAGESVDADERAGGAPTELAERAERAASAAPPRTRSPRDMSAQRPLDSSRPQSAEASAAHGVTNAERRLFHYTDLVAKQELDAYHLREREVRMREQIDEQASVEAAAVDARFAHVEDQGDKLLVAAQTMHTRLFERLALCEVRVNETLAVHAELRQAVQLLRKERTSLLVQLRRAQSRTASLAHDCKHVAHVAHSGVDDAGKIEAKLERTRSEFQWETEMHEKNRAAMDAQAAELDTLLLQRIEDADASAELHKQQQWARLHELRHRFDGLANQHGLLHESLMYIEGKFATVCQLVAVKYDGLLQGGTTAEVLACYRTREAHNTSLWRTADEQTLLREALQAEVRALEEKAARLEASALAQSDEEGRAQDYAESGYEDLEVITSELEPTVDSLLNPIGRLFDELDLYESDQLSPVTGITGLTRETLCEHMHAVDVGVRARQLRAHALVNKRSHAASDALETLRQFSSTLHLKAAPPLDNTLMRSSVLQQVARMETLITVTRAA